MNVFARAVGALTRLCGWFAIACLLAACVVVCQMVFSRYVLEASTIWQTEFVLYAVVAATLLGSGHVLRAGGHVGVDLLGHALPPALRRWQRVVAAVVGLTFVGVLALSGSRYFHEAWAGGWVTESVWAPPLWIVLLPMPLGLGVLALEYLVEIGRLIAAADAAEARD